jgi:glutathione reductase (NADPH)
MDTFDHDLLVIGAGSGGVRAARVAAAHGARVAVAEEHRVGGTCVIRGCVPKKLLVHGAHFAEDLRDAARFGWHLSERRFDWPVLRDHVLAEVDRLNGLYRQTLDHHAITLLPERAVLTGPHQVRLQSGRTVSAKVILVATGATPTVPSIPGAALGITSNEVFHLPRLPPRIVIAGGGYIANEFAGIFHALGADVTLVHRSGRLLRGYDTALSDRLLQISLAKGLQFRFNTALERVDRAADGSLRVQLQGGEALDCDLLLFAIGRQPCTAGLGLENAGVAVDARGAIRVDDHQRTNVPGIYAVGDVTDRVQLTPVAIREGQAFADTVFGGRPRTVDYRCIPSAVFSQPPLAAVGLTEAQARQQLGAVKVYTGDFRPMANVLADRSERALYKMVVDASTDRVVGLHMIGPDAPEILQAAAVAVKAGLTKQAFDDTVALHPSMAEELVLLR